MTNDIVPVNRNVVQGEVIDFIPYSQMPDTDDDRAYWLSYADLYHSFGEVLQETSIGSYQGDTLVLLRHPQRGLGFLEFGWGSCSVCDALEACVSLKDVDDLQQELWDDIHWFESIDDALAYMTGHDFGGAWYGGSDSLDFRAACISILTNWQSRMKEGGENEQPIADA